MHIHGVGTDILEIRRIEKMVGKWGDKFLNRVFCDGEISYARSRKAFYFSSLAARFAAKEAVLKALGTGLSGTSWLDIEIILPEGSPKVLLRGTAKTKAEAMGIRNIHLSLSHSREYATAFVVAEGRG